MRITFVSNYINHHQIPFCNALNALLQEMPDENADGTVENIFTFIQTQKMEADRVLMGWDETNRPAYVKYYYEEEALCRELIGESDAVIFGGVDDESYIAERLQAGKLIFRYCERLYKTGQWKAISPRGLKKKYTDHTRYRNAPVYLLCAGAYVASDYHIIRAYPEKMYCWGYFPETRHYDVDKLMSNKGGACTGDIKTAVNAPGKTEENRIPHLLWAGRMIDWKHPELPLETAKYLKEKGYAFHMDIIGGGELYPVVERLWQEYELQEVVTLRGYQSPEEVRGYMERADIFLFTSDRQEGWGAVANEAMNSGCALIGDHMIGAVPYLVRNGENGLIYQSGEKEQLFRLAEQLVKNPEKCRELGTKAYETIVNIWNAENAAKQLMQLIQEKMSGENAGAGGREAPSEAVSIIPAPGSYTPGQPAPILSERAVKKSIKEV